MFAHLRYFYLISYIVLMALSIFAGTAAKSYIEQRVILPIAQEANINIAESFILSVWQRHFALMNQLPCKADAASGQCPDASRAAEDVKLFAESKKISSLRIFAPEGQNFFDTTNFFTLYNDNKDIRRGFISAQHQKVDSLYEEKFVHPVTKKDLHAVRTYVPLLAPIPSEAQRLRVAGILEVVYDATDIWPYADLLQYVAPIIITLIFGSLFGTAIYASRRAEKIISKQYEESSELMTAKTSAEAENQAKSKFIANVSHELRTPLNAIIGFSEIIKDEVLGPLNNQQYKEYVTDIHSSGVHLLSLINDILDFSKAEAGKLEVFKEEVDVNKILKNSLRLVVTRANDSKVTLEDKIPKDHCVLKTDGKRLKQVILNLLSNSVKFTPEGGTVSLAGSVNQEKRQYIIEVRDTGIGISAKDISKVMSSFGQVDNKFTRKQEGTGLGLPLSKRLVELMGGAMEIHSKEGVGTMIRVILPLE